MRPFSLDVGDNRVDEGKKWITDFLTSRGYTVVDTDTVSKYMHFDLLVTKGNRTIWMELKNRDIPSTRYSDVEINSDKYNFLMGAPDKAVLVYFFSDKWCMVDVKKTPYTRKYMKLAKHSHCWDTRKEMKEFILWDINECNIRLLEYE